MKYSVITVILALGLAGCNLNGLTFDTSTLPNLNIGEVNCNDCNVNLNTADEDQQNVENHYFVRERKWYLGQNPDYVLSMSSSWGEKHKWYYGSKEANDKAYGNVPRRVNVDGDSGLFIEYNFNPHTPIHPNGIEDHLYRNSVENYMVAGGNIEQNYTPMPSGNYLYEGKVVVRSYSALSTYSKGTVNAEVNFTDNVMWIVFEGTGTGIDRRWEDIEIDIESGEFDKVIYDENDPEQDIGGVVGDFIGMEAKGMFGDVDYSPTGKVRDSEIGMFVAERNDTPVVSDN